jgi:predicted RNA-binding protein YlqC (UPF0109 family)
MSEIDQQFIEYVVKSLVGNPDAVQIKRTIDEKGVLLELTVDPEDLGRVIGKRGATAQSLRTLLRALGTKNDARYNLKIIDNGTGGGSARPDDDAAAEDKPDKKAPAPDSKKAEESNEEPSDEAAEEPEATEKPEKPEEVAAEEPEPEAATNHDDGTTDRLAQARKELADLDDLDV